MRRGHTSSSHRAALVFLEQSYADIPTAAEPGQLDAGQDDLAGPADAQLCTVLAWAVRSCVLRLDEARLLARVYGLDGGPAGAGPAVAAECGLSWPTLRQRCYRLARRVGQGGSRRRDRQRRPARRGAPDRPSPGWTASARPSQLAITRASVWSNSRPFSPASPSVNTPAARSPQSSSPPRSG